MPGPIEGDQSARRVAWVPAIDVGATELAKAGAADARIVADAEDLDGQGQQVTHRRAADVEVATGQLVEQ